MSSPPVTSTPIHPLKKPEWLFSAVLVLFSLVVGGFLLIYGVPIFSWITDRLPLLLPLAVTVMSIATRATDIRSYEAVLKTSNDIAIGIISFDIWLLSARSEQTNRVLVNATTMIRGEFAIAFLVLGLVIAVGSLILTHYDFTTQQGRQRALLTGFVFSAIIYIAPFGVLEPVKSQSAVSATQTVAVKHFDVAIPYNDKAVTALAPTALKPRVFAYFVHGIEAPNRDVARADAMQKFLASPDSNQIKVKRTNNADEKVTLVQQDILVAEQ